jgi:MFS family permease
MFPLASALAVDMIGSGLFLPISLLYFTATTGLPLTTVGPLLSAATIAALPVPILVGRLADRYRPRDIVLVAQIAQALGFAGYTLVRGPVSMLLAAIVVMVGQRIFWSAYFALASGLATPGEHPRLTDRRFARLGMVQAAGTGVGALIGGLAVAGGRYRTVVLLDALSFALSALALLRVPRGTPGSTSDDGGGYRVLLRDRPYLLLIVANALFALCSIFLGVAVPVFVKDALPAPVWIVGPLLAANTVLLAVGQGVAVRLVRNLSRSAALVIAAGLWIAWSLVYAGALLVPAGAVVAYLFVGLILYAAADVVHAPISNALAAAAAPPAQRGRYLAIFQYGFALAQIVAPTLFTLLFAHGHALPWLALAVLAAVAGAMMVALGPHLARAETAAQHPAPAEPG